MLDKFMRGGERVGSDLGHLRGPMLCGELGPPAPKLPGRVPLAIRADGWFWLLLESCTRGSWDSLDLIYPMAPRAVCCICILPWRGWFLASRVLCTIWLVGEVCVEPCPPFCVGMM